MSLHEDRRVLFDFSERQRAEDALRRLAERQAMLLEVTSDLIRTSEPGELGRKTFEHVKSAFGAVVCTNYRLDPAAQRLRLVFVHGIPPEYLEAAQSLELGQEYCGAAAASRQPLVADKQRIACDPNGRLVRTLGATAYACYPLKASNGRLLGTFAVASATRESFTDDEVAWLGTITNFLAQAWERLEAEQRLRGSEERLRLSQEVAGLGYWDFDIASGTLVWSDQTCELLGAEPTEPASLTLLLSRVHEEDRPRIEEKIRRGSSPDPDHAYHDEFRAVMQNGAVRWLAGQGRLATNVTGMPVRAFGVIRDVTAQKRAQELLRRQADLLDQSHDAIFTWKIGGGIVYWNRGAEVLYGYTAEDAIGRSSHELLRTVSPIPIHEIEAQIAREGSWYGELTHTRRDGRTIVVESRHVRVCYGGETYALETNRDITERKEREEREHLLMREINHRAKNMLSVVDAIAHQTTTKSPEDFRERLSSRIQALAANQDLLIQNEWRGVEVEDLVCAQLAPFADLVGSRIIVHGPKLRLNAASAQAIGLALHELTTNAGKYGSLSTDRGRVDIDWGADGDTFTMSWTEREGPPVSAPKRRGFGTTVMEVMVERSMDGAVELDYARSGLTWRLICPTGNALESADFQVEGKPN